MPTHSFRPCAHCRASIHIYCRSLVYSPDTSFHTTPRGLSPAEHSLLIHSPRVAHIVSSFRTQYIYPSPALVNDRQLWPISPPLSLCVPGNCGPSYISHNALRSTCYVLDIVNEHPPAAARITTRAHCPRSLPARSRSRVRRSGFIFKPSSRTLARTFRLRYTI